MSYSSFQGSIEFSRDLTAEELSTLRALADAEDYNVFEIYIDGVDGTGGRRAYGWVSVLRKLIEALPDDVTASGYIERAGEESPDLDRLHVLGRRVVLVEPEIVWPEPK